VRDIPRLAADRHRLVDAHAELASREQRPTAGRHERLRAGIVSMILDEARRYDWRLTDDDVLRVFDGDIELNAQGLAD
jgi:hypothetical protein